jgi:tRNA pseudouridine13 synthase
VLRALPSSTRLPTGPIRFRDTDDGFIVEELPAYLPSGEGEHLYLLVEKRGLSTPALLGRLQRALRLHERDIGVAGRKDERGVTRQWVSVPARSVTEPLADGALGDEVRVLEQKLHRNKLRLGHLRGNRFTIKLGSAAEPLSGDDVESVRSRVPLVQQGMPNLFGGQRFGPDNATLREAVSWLSRSRPARSKKEEFLVSAAQSSLFNAWLADRVDDETWRTPLHGDILMKTENGAPFTCDDPDRDRDRARAGEVVVAGPLIGRAMRPSESEAMTRESRSWVKAGVDVAALLAHPAFDTGARRAACIVPQDLACDVDAGALTLRFSLEKGAYASLVLRALCGASLVDAAFLPP